MNFKVIQNYLKKMFFLGGLLVVTLGFSQTKPGGTSLNVELWLQADKLQLIDSSKVETWYDQSIYGRNFSQRLTDSVPLFFFDGMNYNPRLYFGDPSNTKLVGERHFVELGKAYYVFYVSQIEGTIEYETVFSLRSDLNGASGWRHTTAADIPWMRNGIGNQFAVTPNKKYAVNMAYFPNSNPGQNVMFTNGIKYELGTGNNLINAGANDLPIIGVENTGTSYSFKGSISEIIVLSAPNNLGIDDSDIHKINSYLAIKYGIKLDQSSPLNYVDSDGNVIWKSLDNTLYNAYVFGLARDDASGLNQKQSASYDDPSISVFLNELEYTNSANSGEITSDKSFLLLSSNGIFGDGDYSAPSGTAFETGVLNSPINKLSNEILRVSKTGMGIPKFNMSFSQELYQVEYVLVSSDPTFSNRATTRCYQIINGVAKDIEANDGDYIGFTFYRPDLNTSTIAAELWLDANELQVSDGENVSTWYDKSGNNRNFVQNGTNTVPTYDLEGMNFNPKVDFTEASNAKLVGQTNLIDANNAYYVFYVSRVEGTGNQTVFSLRGTLTGSIGWRSNPANPWMYSNTDYDNTSNGLKPYGVNVGYFPNKTTSEAALYADGVKKTFTASNNSLGAAAIPILGVQNTGTSYPLNGYINEVIVFSVPNAESIDEDFVQRVNSYLSLKYGLTMKPIDGLVGTGINYLDSSSAIIWDGTLNTDYNNDIFGIGRDDNSGLYQRQATSYHYNSIAVSLGNLEQSNKKNKSLIAGDKNYLIFGSNGLTGGETYIQTANTTYINGTTVNNAINERYKRTLRVSKLGTAIGAINMTLSNDLSSVPYVMVSKAIDFNPMTTSIYPVINGVAQGLVLEHDDYIGFVLDRKVPGGVSTDVELWLKADGLLLADATDVNTWYDQSLYSRNFVKNETDTSPKFYKEGGMNFNPRINLSTPTNTKLIGPVNIMDSNKEYYIYHVSYSLNTTTATVLSFDQELNNSYGWRGGAAVTHPWLYSGGDRDATLGIGKPYSINAAFSPNRRATGIDAYLYVNGVKNTFTDAGRLFDVSTSTRMTIGTDNLGAGYPFYGDISEIIVLSAPKGSGAPNEDDILRVNSYLALKYGLTIKSNDESSTSNYIASDGTTVIWDATTNTGYNENIFGIGRDDLSALNQKQGTSYEDTRVTAFVGNYENLNSENLGEIPTNRSFLLFGSNKGVGFETYNHIANTQFANGQISERINVRHRFVLKAQNTASFALVNLSVTLGAKYVLVSKDPLFPVGITNIYKIDGNNTASNLMVETGDYIGFGTYAIGPGGVVDGLEVWLSADRANIDFAGGNNVNVWKDISPFGKDYSFDAVNLRGKQYPQFIDCSPLMNFMPTVEFSSTAYLAIFGDARNPAPMSTNVLPEFTTFTAYNSTGAGGSRYYTHGFGGVVPNSGVTRYPAMGFYPPNGAGRLRNDGTGNTNVNGTVAGFIRGATALEMINTSTTTANATFDYGGYEDTVAGGTGFGTGFRLASGGTIGGASINDASFVGVISEIFYYNRKLTNAEQDAIRSYIGAKYAITIRTDQNASPFNYTLSNGDIIWNGESLTNKPYHNDVAGLVRDDQAGLLINIAKSTASGGVITMQAGDEQCNGITSALANDYSGLFWGNNGKAINDTLKYNPNDPLICGAISSRTERIWLVEKTNLTEQRVTIKAGGADFIYNGAGFEVYLLVADSPQKIENKQWDQIIPGTFVDGQHQFTYNFKEEYTYFALAAKTVPGVCESCEFLGVKKLDFRRVNWPLRGEKGPKTFDLQNDFKVTVQVTEASPVLRNRYPRSGSQNTLRLDRGGNAEVLTQINFTNDADEPVSTSTTFEIYNIDRYSRYNLDNVVIKGYCGSGVVAPKLSYVYSRYPDRSSYDILTSEIQGQGLAKARGIRYSGGVGYTNQRGRMLVYFDTAVERIEISYKVDGPDNNGTKRIGIGPMEFTCLKFTPLPEPNDDGLIYTKQGTQEVELCENVDYVFQIINTNCDARMVSLYDQLPSGMVWNDDSLIINSTTVTESDIIFNERELTINNIEVPGGGEPYLIRVSARFEMAATAMIYENTSQINYERVPTGGQSLQSTDRFTGLPQTVTEAKNSSRPEKIASKLTANVGCFDVDQTIEFTLTLNNPNTFSLANTSINFDFDPVIFSLVSGSVVADGITLPTADPDELLMYEGFTVPMGISTIKFRLLVASTTTEFDIDAFTNEFADTTITYDFYIENDDVCLGNLSDSGEFILPYCTYCTQPPMNPVGHNISETKVGLSLLPIQGDQRFENWPQSVPNGFIVFNATKRGLVLTRTTPTAIGEANWVEGMVIYNTDSNCISLYNGVDWKCIQRKCNN